ncbi:hypothetical protein ALC53_07326 [Atta colombica]|uniref:Uncharacterized protein n=1 Tax=Atta colombica TaxID=520822 RepID=A0A195BCP0_9HYME|nr:hypothetical protein ALC53_07326 [Atta colombica]
MKRVEEEEDDEELVRGNQHPRAQRINISRSGTHSDGTAMHIEFIAIDNSSCCMDYDKGGRYHVSMSFHERRFDFRWPCRSIDLELVVDVVVVVSCGEIVGSNDLSEIERIEGAADCV